MSTTVEELQKMKDVLMEKGWCQGALIHGGDGSVCLLGAHNIVVHGVVVPAQLSSHLWYQGPTAEALQNELVKGDWLGYSAVSQFNDWPGRTFNEVLGLIDSAILTEKEKG